MIAGTVAPESGDGDARQRGRYCCFEHVRRALASQQEIKSLVHGDRGLVLGVCTVLKSLIYDFESRF